MAAPMAAPISAPIAAPIAAPAPVMGGSISASVSVPGSISAPMTLPQSNVFSGFASTPFMPASYHGFLCFEPSARIVRPWLLRRDHLRSPRDVRPDHVRIHLRSARFVRRLVRSADDHLRCADGHVRWQRDRAGVRRDPNTTACCLKTTACEHESVALIHYDSVYKRFIDSETPSTSTLNMLMESMIF